MTFTKLIVRNLLRHPLRSLLTVGSLAIALFLLCALRSLETTLNAVTELADTSRMIVQSAVSLYVDLPLNYQDKIASVPGVENTCKWQWFGGYYQEPSNMFGQFAVDPPALLAMYPEIDVIEGTYEAFEQNRRGCVIGIGLTKEPYNFKLGQTVPLVGSLFPHPDGADTPWEFQVDAIYDPTQRSFDPNGMFFHWDYFEKTLETAGESPGIGTIAIKVAAGTETAAVASAIDQIFENGPQRVQTTPEAEFNAQFVSMFGNIPFFVMAIGSAVLIAILLACVNTMLMAGREQTHDIGIMKALGFTDGRMFFVLIAQAAVLCGLGGALGIFIALGSAPMVAQGMSTIFPGYTILPETINLGIVITVIIGLVAGVVPAWRASNLRCVDALGGVD